MLGPRSYPKEVNRKKEAPRSEPKQTRRVSNVKIFGEIHNLLIKSVINIKLYRTAPASPSLLTSSKNVTQKKWQKKSWP